MLSFYNYTASLLWTPAWRRLLNMSDSLFYCLVPRGFNKANPSCLQVFLQLLQLPILPRKLFIALKQSLFFMVSPYLLFVVPEPALGFLNVKEACCRQATVWTCLGVFPLWLWETEEEVFLLDTFMLPFIIYTRMITMLHKGYFGKIKNIWAVMQASQSGIGLSVVEKKISICILSSLKPLSNRLRV